ESAREQVSFFMLQLDKVLGGYIRGQLFLSALAGVLGGAGAAALGVPYPLLIGIMTFLLESVPVMGPVVAFIPPVAIALVFTTPITTLLLFIWFTVFQQVVTNFLGPKIMGTAVGIHPLEAIGAVLVGYPLGGFIGAFLAIPVAGIVHILIRELYAYFALGRALPTAPVIAPAEDVEVAPGQDAPSVPPGTGARPAPG
ncbi:MAG: AI-2E family transporter, partial [Chloroflexi bacterium]|nr:AI-2E family transporter [Chloroflexota bacterium]